MWQHVKLSDVSRYSLVADEDVKKPTNQTKCRIIAVPLIVSINVGCSQSIVIDAPSMPGGEIYDPSFHSTLLLVVYSSRGWQQSSHTIKTDDIVMNVFPKKCHLKRKRLGFKI